VTDKPTDKKQGEDKYMQLRKKLYQVGGDLNGITWNGVDAGFDDANAYVLDTGRGLIMFDCGNGETLAEIFENMAYWGLDPGNIRYCLLTHPHWDHSGAAHLLQERGVHLIAHVNTAEAMAAGDERCCGYLYHKQYAPCRVDSMVKDGDRLDLCGLLVEVMHLPGHTMGCTAYWFEHDGKRIVVSGDVIGTLLCGYFGWDGSIDFHKPTYIESLKRFAQCDSDIMLSGHGLCYFHQPRRRVEEVLNEALIQWR
jgi:glyoxylase-like metal-dependent hydrolase (beta-lactamase superfamily II)